MTATNHERRAAILRKIDDAPNATVANDLRCQLEEIDAEQSEAAAMTPVQRWMHRLLRKLFRHRRIMNCERQAYLWRFYIIRTKWVAVFLHNFVRSDEYRALHDHPWDFIVIPIWRGYWEHHECRICQSYEDGEAKFPACAHVERTRAFPLIGTRFRRASYAHRVELLTKEAHCVDVSANSQPIVTAYKKELPAWSLFIRFRERRDWGFRLADKWQDWRFWWKEKCE